jgi:hypothetical protein
LITTIFKKNENDLLLIDEKFNLQTAGKNIKNIIKHASLRTEINFLFKNLKRKIINAEFNIEKCAKTIIYN